jgi:hypothetical protein
VRYGSTVSHFCSAIRIGAEHARNLPVDAFYTSLSLAVEYRERQHSEAVPFMDRRNTISGCTRGEQRRRYDERRRVELSKHGVKLVELDFSMFDHDGHKRLRRNAAADESVVRARLYAAMSSEGQK